MAEHKATTAPQVEPGQVWADNDPRSRGRTLRIETVDTTHATCTVLTDGPAPLRSSIGRLVRISLRRFKPTSTGYRLIREGSQP